MVGVILLMFGAMIKRLYDRLDGKANKESTDKRFDAVMGELKEQRKDLKDHVIEDRNMHTEVLGEMRETNKQLAVTNVNLARLAGKVEERDGQ